jgi:hypothetical protein
MKFTVYSSRRYGEPKLAKPKELSGISPSFSEDYIPRKCKFQVFVLKEADEIWIKATDWFSPEFMPPDIRDAEKPQNAILAKYFPTQKPHKENFVYANNFASVVLRCEAWLCYSGIFRDIEEYERGYLFQRTFPVPIWLREEMTRRVEEHYSLPTFELMCSDLERFYERVIDRIAA